MLFLDQNSRRPTRNSNTLLQNRCPWNQSLLSENFTWLEFRLNFQFPSRGSNYQKKYSYSDQDLLKTLDKRHLQLQPRDGCCSKLSVVFVLLCALSLNGTFINQNTLFMTKSENLWRTFLQARQSSLWDRKIRISFPLLYLRFVDMFAKQKRY